MLISAVTCIQLSSLFCHYALSNHQDYLSVTSNFVEEFTLILCVTDEKIAVAVQGGETLIYPYASEKGVAFDTVTPGKGLLFRKDLEHAGGLLKAGEKHILTANVWGIRKQTSDQVLFVTFPTAAADDEKESKPSASASSSTSASGLKSVASQGFSYALPVDCLKGSMLDAHIRFVNQKYEQAGEDPPTIVTYHCSDFTYDEFGTVAKVLLRSYVQEDDISKHATALDFFGPFAAENLLVNLAVEQGKEEAKDSEADEKTCKRFVQPTNVQNIDDPASKKAKSESSTGNQDDFGVIVCENESRLKVVYDVARTLGFNNYVPFKMIFVQGIFLHGYYDNRVNIPVTPAGLVVGDYNHIYGIQNIGGQKNVGACTLEDYHTKHNYFSDANTPGWDEEKGTLFRHYDDEGEEVDYDYYERDYDKLYTFRSKPRGLGLKLALGDKDVRGAFSEYVLANPHSEHYCGGAEPDSFEPLVKFLEASTPKKKAATSPPTATGLFHRDDAGKVTFTSEEAEAASQYIASMNLDERVKAAVQKKRFVLPQEMEEKDDYYCNESTYSNLSILFVTGLVRLDPTIDPASLAVTLPDGEFDAWPTEEHTEKTKKAIRKHFKDMGLGNMVNLSFLDGYDY